MGRGNMAALMVAKRLYRALPLPLRKASFQAYSAAVRHSVRQRDLGGYVAELHLSEVMEIAAYLDEFEPEVRDLIDRFAAPGNVALDIGANVGLHALRIASRAGPDGKVHAFEPTDFSFRKLSRNAGLNPHLNIAPLQLALSNENKPGVQIDFRTSWRTDGGRSDTAPSITDFLRLDDWAEQVGLDRLELIKIDVDGFEGLVIEGGIETISRFKPVILMEAFEGQFSDARPSGFELLESIGYRFYTAKDHRRLMARDVEPMLKAMREKGLDSFNLYALT